MSAEHQHRNARKHYILNRDKYLARSKERLKTPQSKAWFYARHRDPAQWPKQTCYYLKSKCKERGLPFDLKPADIVIPSVCPITRLPFDFSSDKGGKPRPQSPSVDRIIPERGYVRGYVRGNVRVLSLQANVARSNIRDPEVFRRLYEDALLWSLA